MLDIESELIESGIATHSAEPKQSSRGRNLGVAGSLLLSLIAAAGAVWVWNSYNSTTGIVIAGADLAPGTVIESTDLLVIEGNSHINSFSNPDDLIGQVVQYPVAGSDIIQLSDLGSVQPVQPGNVVIGVLATPGMYPTPDIAAGDIVDVFGVEVDSQVTTALATDARVFEVSRPELGAATELLISVEVPAEKVANNIATASQTPGGVRFAIKAQ